MANALLIPDKTTPSPRAGNAVDSTPVVQAHFDRLGRNGYWEGLYANITDPAIRWSFIRRQAILESLLTPLVQRGSRVVEIGPGTGNLVGFFASRGCHYRAFDAAAAMVNATNEAIVRHPGLAPGSSCECGDIHALPLDDGHADVVVAAGVIEYLDDPRPAMAELSRITRSKDAIAPANEVRDPDPGGGVALITLPNSSSLNRTMTARLSFLTDVAKRMRQGRTSGPATPDVRRTAYSPARFAADVAGANWWLDRVDYYDVEAMPYPLNRIAGRAAFAAKRFAESSKLSPKSILANGMVLSLLRIL